MRGKSQFGEHCVGDHFCRLILWECISSKKKKKIYQNLPETTIFKIHFNVFMKSLTVEALLQEKNPQLINFDWQENGMLTLLM